MRVVGLDPSLTSTGFAAPAGVRTVPPPKGMNGVKRLRWLRDELIQLCAAADLVVIEGIALAAQGAYRSEQAGLGWLVRVALFELGVPYVDVMPTTLKVIATGKGRHEGKDSKAQMLTSAVRLLGYRGHSHDEADALWLRQAALVRYNLPGAVKLPATHTRTLDKIAWPTGLEVLPAAMELPLAMKLDAADAAAGRR